MVLDAWRLMDRMTKKIAVGSPGIRLLLRVVIALWESNARTSFYTPTPYGSKFRIFDSHIRITIVVMSNNRASNARTLLWLSGLQKDFQFHFQSLLYS